MPLIFAGTGNRLILFAHVPKAGGTSVETYLEARFGGLMFRDHSWANTDLGRRSLVASPQHLDGPDLDRLFPAGAINFSFAVVRDPVARAVSEYKYQNWPHNIRSPWRRRFAKFGFSVWLAMALAAARRDPLFLDNHMRPQVEMLPREVEVFRLEDGFAALIARLDTVTGTTAPDLEIGHELRGPGPDRTARPSRQDLALIVAAFSEDFARFGYAVPDLAAAPDDGLSFARHALGRALAPLAAWMYRTGRM